MNLKKLLNLIISLSLFIILDLSIGSWYLKKTNNQPYKNSLIKKEQNWNRVGSPVFHHGLIPNTSSMYSWEPNKNYPVFSNSLGMFDKEMRSVPLESSNYRILFLGDSFVEGIGNPYDETFVGILDRNLPETIELLNGGLSSYSPKLYYLRTKYLLEEVKIKIDEVIIFIDPSDIANEVLYYDDFEPKKEYISPYYLLQKHDSFFEKIKGNIIDHSISINLISQRIIPMLHNRNKEGFEPHFGRWSFDKKYFDEFGKEGLRLSAENMKNLIDLLKQNEISRITIVVYPWPIMIEANDFDSIQESFWKEFSETEDVNFISLFKDFFVPNSTQNFFLSDREHWNFQGHQIVANSLIDNLKLNSRTINDDYFISLGLVAGTATESAKNK